MSRLAAGVAAGALALVAGAAATPPAHAGGLKTCNDYVKAKNVSCRTASSVAEQGLATALDQDKSVVRFDGWTCRLRDDDGRALRCVKTKKDGTRLVVKYRS